MLRLAIQRVEISSTRMNLLMRGMQIRFTEFKHGRTAAAGNGSLNKSDDGCSPKSHNLKTFATLIRLRLHLRKRAEWNSCDRRGRSPCTSHPKAQLPIFFVVVTSFLCGRARKLQPFTSCELWSDPQSFKPSWGWKSSKTSQCTKPAI